MKQKLVFVHHTLQYGYPLAETYAKFLDPPVGRFRTVERFPLVVPFEAKCYNEDCGFEHRVCGLLNIAGEGHRVEGDLFEVNADQLRRLDREEEYDPKGPPEFQGSIRRTILVEPLAGGDAIEAEAHFNESATESYLSLVESDLAEMVPCYTREMAAQTPKQCCVENPGHDGPHTVSEAYGCDGGE